MPGKCQFKKEWVNEYKWLEAFDTDKFRAKCTICNRDFSIGNKGISDVKQHMQSNVHKTKENAAASTVPIDRLLTSKID